MRLLQNKRFLISLIIMHFLWLMPNCMAQNDQKQKNEKEFNNFQNKVTNDFENFQSKNDSIFLHFLESAWKEFHLFREENKVRVKPIKQPFVDSVKMKIEKVPIKNDIQGHQEIMEQGSDQSQERILEESKGKHDFTSSVDFFGQQVDLPANNDLPAVKTINTAEIIKYYTSYLANKQMVNSTGVIYQFAQERLLNDWGYLYLVILASEKFYQEMNNRVLFVWMTLLKKGFDVKLGHDAKNIYLLVNFEHRIFNNLYVNILNQRYYVYTLPLQSEPQAEISSYETVYPHEVKPVSQMIFTLPLLNGQMFSRKVIYNGDTFSLSLGLPLIDYMNAYPACELSVYFNAPASEKAMRSMDKILSTELTGKSETEKVAMLLNFVQRSFPYKIDEQQFGKEKYMFADETMYYPYSDCEDRAILLSKLIERYTSLKTVGLEYSDHVSLGVMFTKPLQGDLVYFKGEKYYICDPTYIGAQIGMAMDFMKTETPSFIQTSLKN